MAAQNLSSPSVSSRQSTSAADSVRAKKARTKHACDECRRSQKKVQQCYKYRRKRERFMNLSFSSQCDGEQVCYRCRSNGTQCVYTPHKSRNSCACVDQNESHLNSFVPDVHISADCMLWNFDCGRILV